MKQIQAGLALALLLLTGLNCGTENPLEETGDTLAVETVATGAFSGEIELIGDETIYVRVLKAGRLIAQMEFAKRVHKGSDRGWVSRRTLYHKFR